MKLIIFDIDGTLTDTKEVDDSCFIKAFDNTFNLNIQNQIWADLKNITDWGITEEIINQRLKRNPTKLEYQQMQKAHVNNLANQKKKNPTQFSPVTGVNEFIRHLKADPNFKIGIATGAWQKSALIKLASIELNPLELPFSNSDYFKTREEITMHTIKQSYDLYPFKLEEIIYFGDGEWDYKTCKNLNIRFIGIDVKNDQKLLKLGAKEVYNDFSKKEAILNVLKA